jgi:hypothetical protein
MTIGITINPGKTILLFSTTCCGLEGHNQAEQKNERVLAYTQFIFCFVQTDDGLPGRNM